jgi:transcriptional regulator with XRE-family HTH domain
VRIGPALAGARTKAGMSVEDVSERTRIRRTIISDIERDDYASCGGDFYARGHIRAIAKVVGTDPVPLIEQYDDDLATREQEPAVTGPDPQDWLDADSGARSLLGQLPAAGPARPGGPAGKSESRAVGRSDTMPQPAVLAGIPDDLTVPAGPPGRAVGPRAAEPANPAIRNAVAEARRIGAQSAQQAGTWLRQGGTRLEQAGTRLRQGGTRLERAGTWIQQAGTRLRQAGAAALERFTRVRTGEELPSRILGALAIFLAALIAVLYGIFSGPARSAPRPAVTPTHSVSHPTGTRSAASRLRRSAPAAGAAQLQPVRAVAFGPGGIADGDNPQLAGRAIGAQPGGWNTNWYTTAEFGGLQAGTGLLLDLGRPATVTGVTVRLGPAAGALLQLRAGNAAVPSGLRMVAQASGRGGDVTLSPPAPVQARYLLIWFTRLPPDASGTYQATIYHVSVTGKLAGA